MKFDFDVSKEDIIYFQNLYSLKTQKKMRSNLLIFIFIIIGIIGFFIISKFVSISNIIIYTLIILLIIIFFFWIHYKKILKITINENTAGFGHFTFEFTNDGFKVIRKVSETFNKWSAILHIENSQNYILLYTANNAAYIFPKRIFSSDEEAAKFIKFIEENTGKQSESISVKLQKRLNVFPFNRKIIFLSIFVLTVYTYLNYVNPSSTSDKHPLPKYAVFNKKHKELSIGDRLALFGGYDYEPHWLNGNRFYTGTVIKFIPGQGDSEKSVVVRLDSIIHVENSMGQYLVLETRLEGQNWEKYGPVHIELCNFEPDSLPYESRQKGVWVEAAASYEFEELYNKYSAEYDSLLKVYEFKKNQMRNSISNGHSH